MSRKMTATHWGLVRPVYENDRLAGFVAHEADPRPSPVLGELARLATSASRIRKPAVREGFLAGRRTTGEARGREPFVEVTWDEALDLAASELDRVYRDYGPSAVFGRSYGWKSTGLVNSSITLLQRLLNLCGGFVRTTNSYSTAAIATILPYVLGEKDPRSEAWESVLENAERVVFWGCDPLITNDIDWTTTLHNAAPYYRALRDSSIETLCINPLRPATARFLKSRWLSPQPGTDTALMLGVMHALLENGADEDLIRRLASGWDELKAVITGAADGVAKTPAWAARETGIAEDVIRSLARDWQTHRTKIVMGWGPQRRPYGEQMPWMATALAVVLGQIGLPGGGVSFNAHYSQGGCPAGAGPRVRGITEKVAPARAFKDTGALPVIPVARFADCFLNPGKTIDYNGRRVTYPDVKLVFWAGGNPFAHQPQTARLMAAWRRPETVIVADSVWTATARHADIVLPAQTVFEHNDITGIGTYTNDGVAAMQALMPPADEARSDYEILQGLARRLGVEAAFTEGRTMDEWIRTIYDETAAAGRAMGVELPAFDDFWREGAFFYERREADRHFVPWADYRRDPVAHPLKTESGRIQLYSSTIASYHYPDCPGLPSYLPEKGGRPAGALAFLSPKFLMRLHSQLDGVQDDPGARGRERCRIHPADAKARGIADGDTVKLANERGAALFAAQVTEDVMAGAVAVAHGAWCEPLETEKGLIDNHGCANMLTQDEPTSALACGNIASGGWVTLEKWTGPDRPVQNRQAPLVKPARSAA